MEQPKKIKKKYTEKEAIAWNKMMYKKSQEQAKIESAKEYVNQSMKDVQNNPLWSLPGNVYMGIPNYGINLAKGSFNNLVHQAKMMGLAQTDNLITEGSEKIQKKFKFGGNLNNSLKSENDLTHINEGGTHSQNPLGGVAMGQGNSVEEGETIKNDFVYSNRLFLDENMVTQFNLPKSLIGKSIADATKIIDGKFKDRTDKISMSTKNLMLDKIGQAQEAMKPQEPEQQMQPQMEQQMDPNMSDSNMMQQQMQQPLGQNQMFLGGEMKSIEPYGASMQQGANALTAGLSGNRDGMVDGLIGGGLSAAGTAIGGPIGGMIGNALAAPISGAVNGLLNKNKLRREANSNHIAEVGRSTSDFAYGGKMYKLGGPILDNSINTDEIEALRFANKNAVIQSPAERDMMITEGSNPAKNNLDMSLFPDKQNKKFDFNKLGSQLGQAARYAPVAMNAYQLSQLKKPGFESLNRLDQRYKPEYVDEKQLQNIANSEMNNVSNSLASATNGSTGSLRSNLLGASLNRGKTLSEAYANAEAQNRATNERGQAFNADQNARNQQIDMAEQDINARNRGNYDTQKSRLLAEIGNNIGGIGTEQVFKEIAKTTTGYNFLGKYMKENPNATEKQAVEAYQKQSKPMKLGGYLMKKTR